jgi:hypothetical protein
VTSARPGDVRGHQRCEWSRSKALRRSMNHTSIHAVTTAGPPIDRLAPNFSQSFWRRGGAAPCYFLSPPTTLSAHRQITPPALTISPSLSVHRVSARRGRHGAVRVSHAGQDGPLPLHRRPRAMRRLHRLSYRRGRGPSGLHVLQDCEFIL